MKFGKSKEKRTRRRTRHYLASPKGIMLKKQMRRRRAKNKVARASRQKNRP